jgi:amino acid efflux transporter
MGTMNVYLGGASKLAASLAVDGALPPWFAGDADRSVPRRPLLVFAVAEVALLTILVAGWTNTSDLVRATSACFIAVYVLALFSALRILTGRIRAVAALALASVLVLAVFSTWFLVIPVVAAAASLAMRRSLSRGAAQMSSLRTTSG